MKIIPIKTRPLLPPQDDLFAVIDDLDLNLKEGSVLAVTAKVVAIHQGRCVVIPTDETERLKQKDDLIKAEAELYLERDLTVPWPRMFTIYEGTLCSSCGIDESNGNGYWTLLPKNSSEFAAELRSRLCERYQIKNLGIIVTDSRGFPMRNGTIGMTIGYAGFRSQFDYRNKKDIFGKPFRAERINVADCLASTAILAMGEGDESTPLAVMSDIPHIEFANSDKQSDNWLKLKVEMDNDVFTQFYVEKNWQPGGRSRL